MVTTYVVSGEIEGRLGKFIKWLLGDPASPIQMLLEKEQVSSNEEGRWIKFHLKDIRAEDLSALTSTIRETKLPSSFVGYISSDAWDDAKRQVLRSLRSHSE